MNTAQIKTLFARHNQLRLSVQGQKTQQGYDRAEFRAIGKRIEPLETGLQAVLADLDRLIFGNLLVFVSIALFYGMLILGWMMR